MRGGGEKIENGWRLFQDLTEKSAGAAMRRKRREGVKRDANPFYTEKSAKGQPV